MKSAVFNNPKANYIIKSLINIVSINGQNKIHVSIVRHKALSWLFDFKSKLSRKF
jgi:hypothetical protein